MNYPTTSIAPRILFRDGALEMGPKTFFRKDDDYLDNLYTELFRTYRQLLKDCENVSLYFWLGDGSEILEYNRDFDQEVSWAKWQGFAHRAKNAAFGGRPATLYTDHPVDLTYGDIRRVVSIAKACCRRVLGKELKFVLPFDPGSEFTASPFRYERHTEILVKSNSGQVIRNIDALSRFHADTHPYACYPDGIPEGTPCGEFLGKQAQAYLSDMGADGIWF